MENLKWIKSEQVEEHIPLSSLWLLLIFIELQLEKDGRQVSSYCLAVYLVGRQPSRSYTFVFSQGNTYEFSILPYVPKK